MNDINVLAYMYTMCPEQRAAHLCLWTFQDSSPWVHADMQEKVLTSVRFLLLSWYINVTHVAKMYQAFFLPCPTVPGTA